MVWHLSCWLVAVFPGRMAQKNHTSPQMDIVVVMVVPACFGSSALASIFYSCSVAAALGGLVKPQGVSVLCVSLCTTAWFFSFGLIQAEALPRIISLQEKNQEKRDWVE